MEGEEGGGIRLSKRFDDYNKKSGGGDEVDYKNKSGTAWSHSYLNQKPWHPLSYPNQRRKWIAEQTHAQRERRTEEVAREYAQEQEFFRQTALISKKEKEKIEMMKAVSFMYVRPPGYNAESAKAAEIADASQPPAAAASSSSNSMHPESVAGDHKKKPRPKDAFGRPLPTQEEFQVLTNAPRLETGVPARVKPFGIEVRNVKCLRCGKYGHQSGDRECPLKDVIMPNEESRLKRDDPLTAIVAQTDPSEPLKWELKQKPGISPPRGGFNPDDPNQQIVAEDIFDEYGGFLSGGNIPDLLTNFSPSDRKKKSKRSKHKKEPSPSREIWEESGLSSPSNKEEKRSNEEKKRKKRKGWIILNQAHPKISCLIGIPKGTSTGILILLKFPSLTRFLGIKRARKNIITLLNLILTGVEVRAAEKKIHIRLYTSILRGVIEVAGTSNLILTYPLIPNLIGSVGVKIILAATSIGLIHNQNEFVGVIAFPSQALGEQGVEKPAALVFWKCFHG